MRPVLYLEPVGGIAGDMFLAAALDLGVPRQELERALGGLGVSGWRFEVSRAVRHAISGTHVDVVLDGAHTEHAHGHAEPHAHAHDHRALSDIRRLIEAAPSLPVRAKERALRVFQLIGEAEAKVHGVPVEEIHFHEVGAVDSIVDVCGAAVVLELLGDPEVLSGPPPLGSGSVRVAHGEMPVPVPATLELLRGVPVRFEGHGELTTPTGAALLKAFARVGAAPPLVLSKVGYGVGTKDFSDRPNVLRASLGERADAASADAVHVVEANLDDCSPQLLGALVETLLEKGALDAYVLPATMKKGRPGHLLGALVDDAHREAVVEAMLAESTTLGVRAHRADRTVLGRRFETVQTPWGPVQVKLGLRDGQVRNVAPEFEDCRARAQAAGVPVKQVWSAALAAALNRG